LYNEKNATGRIKMTSVPSFDISRQTVISQQEMLALGAGGYLSRAFERFVPINRLDGLEPRPQNNESEDGEYHAGTPITAPIEVSYDRSSDMYTVWAGNHRIAQAIANGQTHIRAFVGPDLSTSVRNDIGQHCTTSDPDRQMWLNLTDHRNTNSATVKDGADTPPLSDEWFARFLDCDNPHKTVREFAVDFCRRYNICGTGDPGYIANVAAKGLGLGDGSGHYFGREIRRPEPEQLVEVSTRLQFSYATSIAESGENTSPSELVNKHFAAGTRKLTCKL
jgi:hypothetical protein